MTVVLGAALVAADTRVAVRAVRRPGQNLIGILLAGAALSAMPAGATTLDLGGLPATRTNLDSSPGTNYTFVQNGPLTLSLISNYTFGGVLRDGVLASLSLTTTGNGRLTLTGANTYSGTTQVGSGGIRAGAANTLSPNSVIKPGGGGLDLGGFNQTIAGLSGSGSVFSNTGAATLTIQSPAGNRSYSGTLTEGPGATITLVKAGAGQQTLNNTNNYSGGTQIAGGTLGAGTAASLGTGGIEFTGTSMLAATGQSTVFTNAITLDAGVTGTLFGNLSVFTGKISGPGALATSGTVEIDNTTSDYTGGTVLNDGTLTLGGDNVLGQVVAGNTLTLAGGARLNAVTSAVLANNVVLNGNLATESGIVRLNGAVSGTGAVIVRDGATLILGHANSFTGGAQIVGGVGGATLGVASNTAIAGGILATGNATLRAYAPALTIGTGARLDGTLRVDTNGFGLTMGGAINDKAGGTGALVVDGGGTLTLTAVSNGYSAGTTVQGGSTLSVASNAQLGSGNVGVTLNNGTLAITSTGFGMTTRALNLAALGRVTVVPAAGTVGFGLISGSGPLYKAGAGTLSVGGVNTYTGGTVVTAGNIDFKTGTGFGSGAIELDTGGAITTAINGLDLGNAINLQGGTIAAGGANLTLSGQISGGTLVKTGTGRFDLNHVNTYADTDVQAGGIRVGANGALGVGQAEFHTGTALAASLSAMLGNAFLLDGSIQVDAEGHVLDIAGPVTGAGGFHKINGGTLILSGAGSNTGGNIIDAGTLQVTGSTTGTTIAAAATLTGTGSFSGTSSLNGTIAPGVGAGGIGTLTFANLNIFSGAVLNFDLGAPAAAHDLINVVGGLQLYDSTLNVNPLAGFGLGTYRLINYGGLFGVVNGGLTTGSLPGGFNYSVATGGGHVDLHVNPLIAGPQYWDGAGVINNAVDGGPGTWTAASNNWTDINGLSNQNWLGHVGFFTNTGGAVTVVGTQAFDQLNFTVDGYTLTGGTLAGTALAQINVSGPAQVTIGSTVTGASGLTKGGGGVLELGSSANSFASLHIAGGILVGDSAGAVGGGPITIDSGAGYASGSSQTLTNAVTLTGGFATIYNAGNTLALQGPVGGAGNLIVRSEPFAGFSGQTSLAAGNTYAGSTVVIDTVLVIGADSALGAAGSDLSLDDAVLETTASITSSRGVTLASGIGGEFLTDVGTTLTLNGIVAGGQLTKDGAGTLVLFNAANSYTGGTAILGGTVAIASDGALGVGGAVDIGTGGTLRFDADIITVRPIHLNGSATFDTQGFADGLGGGFISGTGSLTKVGTGSLYLYGGSSYSGGTFVNAGTLILDGGSSAGTGPITLADTTTLAAGNAGTVTLSRAVTLTGGTATLSGTISPFILTGNIDGAGQAFITGNVTLSGNNSYGGGTVTGFGSTLNIGSNTALGIGTLTLGGFSSVLNNSGLDLALANTIDASSLSAIGGNNRLTLNGPLIGNGGLIKAGSGTLVLANANNSFSGDIGVNAGRLEVDGTLTSPTVQVNVGPGGELGGIGTIAGAVNASGGTISPGNGPGTLTVGSLTLSNTSTLNYELGQAGLPNFGGPLNDRIIVNGNVVLGGATLNVAETAGGAFTPGLYNVITYTGTGTGNLVSGTIANGLTVSIFNNTVAKQVNLVASAGAFSVVQYWDGTDQGLIAGAQGGNGTWNAGSFNWTNATGDANAPWLGDVGVFGTPGGTVQLIDALSFNELSFTADGYTVADAGGSLSANTQPGGALIAVSSGATATIDAPLTGGAISKIFGGTLVLDGANTNDGFFLSDGTVQVGSNTALGTGVVIAENGTTLRNGVTGTVLANAVTLHGSVSVDSGAGSFGLSGPVGGAGDLIKLGSGTLFLTGADSYGNLLIDSGTVSASAPGGFGTAQVYLQGAGATVQVTNSFAVDNGFFLNELGSQFGTFDTLGNTLTVNNQVYGGGTLVKVGSGRLVLLDGGNSYNGGTLLNAGSIQVGASGALSTGALTTAANTTLVAGTAAGQTIILDNDVVLNGATTINLFGTTSSITPGATVTTNGTFLVEGGVISGAGPLTIGGGNVGTVLLSGSNTYGGGTTVAAGNTIEVGNNRSLGTGAVNLNGANLLNVSATTVTLLTNQVNASGSVYLGGSAGDLVFSQALTGNANVTKAGLDRLTLFSANNTLSGTLNVAQGSLRVNGALTDAGLAVTVASAATLTGSGSIAGTVTVNPGGIIAPGDGIGTLTVGGLSLSGGAKLNFDLGAPNVVGGAFNDRIVVNGNVALNPGILLSVADSGSFGIGAYNLIQYTGSLSGTGTDITIASLPGGYSGTVQAGVGTGQVNLLVLNPGTIVQYWDDGATAANGSVDGGSGTWNNANANWTTSDGGINSSWVRGVAVFQGTSGTVSVAAPETFVGLQFLSDGYHLTAGGGSLVTDAAGSFVFTAPGASATISTPITGPGGLAKQGPGTLTLDGTNSYASTDIQGGTLLVGSDGAVGSGAVTIEDGATLGAVGTRVLTNAIVTAGAATIDSGTEVFSLDGQVTGAGSISKTGSGILVLNGANGFGGGLNIVAGNVTIGTDTAAGTGRITIGDGTTLAAGVSGLAITNAVTTTGAGTIDSSPGVFSVDGIIGGTGSITKTGNGILVLNGNNAFAGGLTIAAGEAVLGTNTAAGGGAITIGGGTTLTAGVSGLVIANAVTTTGAGTIDSSPGIFTIGGSIGGAGSITKIAGGNLVLNGSNSFGGGLTIAAGTVTLGTSTAAGGGTIAIGDGTTLAAGAAGLTVANAVTTAGAGSVDTGTYTFTLGGQIGGAGSITKLGTGNLILGGANAFAGGLVDNAGTVTLGTATAAGTGPITLGTGGTLTAANGLTIANAVQLTGNGSIDTGTGGFALSGLLGGAGGFVKTGIGTLTLTGAGTYAGPTTAAAGSLLVNGSITSAVTAQSGATIGGSGTIGALTAAAGSTVAPGSTAGAVGNLTVTGNAAFAAGSTYSVTISGATADKIVIGGTATLGNANLAVSAGAAPPLFFTTYQVLTAAGGRSGQFTPVLTGFSQAFAPVVLYGTNDVRLTINPASIVGLLGTAGNGSSNINNFAAAFDASVAGGFNPQAFFPIFLQSPAVLAASLNQLTGEISSANSRTAMTDTRYVREAALDRLGMSLASTATTATSSDGHGVTTWARGVGSWQKSDSDGNGARLDINSAGVIAGIDGDFGGGFRAGALFNYIRSNVDTTSQGRGRVESTGGGAYAGYRSDGGLAVGVGGAVSHVRSHENRDITVPGIAQSLSGRTGGTSYQGFGELSFDLAATPNAHVQPFVRGAYVKYRVDSFAESGGFAALTVAKSSYDTGYITAGVRGSILLGGSATLKGSAGYQYTTGDRAPISLVSLAGTGGIAAIRPVPLDKSSFAGELGLDVRLARNVTLGAGYSGVIGKHTQDNGVKGTLTIGF